jgi:NitT/TauT family transport system substrate-binding protein
MIAGAFPESVLLPRAQGIDIKMFYALCNLPVYKWYSKPELKSVKEAKGKKFAVSKIGSQSDVMTRWVIRKAGLDPEKEVQIIQSGGPMDRLSALMTGAVDVAILSDPGSFMAESKGFNLLLSLDQFVKGYPNETYNGLTSFIRENPETIKAFLRASNKAIELLRTDEKKALAVIAKYVKVTGENALQAYRSYRDSYPIDGSPPLDGIELLQEICVASGDMKAKMPEKDIIDYTYINMFRK